LNANCPDKLHKVQRQIAVPGARAAVFSFGNDVDDSVEIVCRPCGMDMAPVSPTVPAKSMIKVGVWCVVVLFALSIATAVCLDHRNTAPEYDNFVFATTTVDSSPTNGDGRIGSFSRIPAWMSAVNSDLAVASIPTVCGRLCSDPACTQSTQYRRPTRLRACRRPRVPAIERLLNPPFPILEHSTSTT
jgi:hypothetical protein